MVYWKAQGVPVRITRNLLWGKNPTAEQNPAAEENAEEITGSVERESVQNLPLEEAEPMAVEITEQETENATAVMTEEPKAEVDAEEIAEPAFVSVQILEEPLPEILEPVPVEPVKKTVRKKSGNTRKKNTANMTEKKTTEKTVDKKASEKKAAEEPDELAQAVEKVLSDQTIVPQVVKFIRQYKTKQGINNALNKEFKDSKRTSEIYSAIKPLIADKKGK